MQLTETSVTFYYKGVTISKMSLHIFGSILTLFISYIFICKIKTDYLHEAFYVVSLFS